MRSDSDKFSVIIPVLNEEENIAACLQNVRSCLPKAGIIIVDAGSSDKTVSIASQADVLVFLSKKGRGTQLNTGARQANGQILLFLHADTRLPQDTSSQLNKFFQDNRVKIGTFRLRYDLNHWFLNLSAYFTRFDSVFTNFGDRCIVVRKDFFQGLGGFPEWPLFEDIHFLRLCRSKTKVFTFPGPVITSARRYKHNGVIRQQLLNTSLVLQYLLGANPLKLAQKYNISMDKPV